MLFYLPCFFWGQSLIFVQLSSTTFCIEIYTHFSGLFLHISHNNITMQHLTIRKFIFWLLTNQFSCSIMSDSLWPHGFQHARPSCPSPTPGAYSVYVHWVGDAIQLFHLLSVPFSSCLQSFPASGSFPVSLFFASGGQSIGMSASASVLPMNIQYWFPLVLTDWISLQSKGLSRVFSNTTVQKHPFFSAQLSLWFNSQHLYVTTGKTIALTIGTFVGKVISLLFKTLFWHSCSFKEQASFNFMAAVTICIDFGAQESEYA